MVYLAKMVVGFIFYDVVRCWCLFPGTALWEWVLNSGLDGQLPSASCKVISSLIDFFAAMFLVLLDVAMMWLASRWHCCPCEVCPVAHVCGFARCVQSQQNRFRSRVFSLFASCRVRRADPWWVVPLHGWCDPVVASPSWVSVVVAPGVHCWLRCPRLSQCLWCWSLRLGKM